MEIHHHDEIRLLLQSTRNHHHRRTFGQKYQLLKNPPCPRGGPSKSSSPASYRARFCGSDNASFASLMSLKFFPQSFSPLPTLSCVDLDATSWLSYDRPYEYLSLWHYVEFPISCNSPYVSHVSTLSWLGVVFPEDLEVCLCVCVCVCVRDALERDKNVR